MPFSNQEQDLIKKSNKSGQKPDHNIASLDKKIPPCNKTDLDCLSSENPQICTTGSPCKKILLGKKKICKKWILGVIFNRHYKNAQQWNYNDGTFNKSGYYRTCEKWVYIDVYKQ